FIAENLVDQYRVATAFDGKDGLVKAMTLKPDLVLVDIMMSEMKGEDLLRAIRQRAELASTPFVILSAKAIEDLTATLLREGAQDYLAKPFCVEELRARVSNVLAKKRAEDCLRVVVRDVTELKHAHEELAADNASLMQLHEVSEKLVSEGALH